MAEAPSAEKVGSSGTFSSSTMMVMMMARTPSLNASSRLVLMGASLTTRSSVSCSSY